MREESFVNEGSRFRLMVVIHLTSHKQEFTDRWVPDLEDKEGWAGQDPLEDFDTYLRLIAKTKTWAILG